MGLPVKQGDRHGPGSYPGPCPTTNYDLRRCYDAGVADGSQVGNAWQVSSAPVLVARDVAGRFTLTEQGAGHRQPCRNTRRG
jgi:hypothetical protein